MKQPFSNGSEFADWYGHNCDACTKGPPPDHVGHNERCVLEDTLTLACCTDGLLTLDGAKTEDDAAVIAQRLGWDGVSAMPARCAEFEAKEVKA